ncbi:MAG TPA: hypothetical protein VK943_08990, partial [Arenibaculum sp.]|nr:hypothetical protein [Arenibaculum sp.]
AACLVPGPAPRAGEPAGADLHGLSLFAAQMTDNTWEEVALFDDVGLRDSFLAGIGLSRRLAAISDKAVVEVEGQVVRHFGTQRHWEFNAAVIGRWTWFPWNETLPTSIAWGIGPSYATRVPIEEVERSGDSQRLLVYWLAELEVGLPDASWTGFARLHHRSGAFGLIAGDGGSNWLTLGLRRRF